MSMITRRVATARKAEPEFVKAFRNGYLPQPLRSGFTGVFGRNGPGEGIGGHPYQIVLMRSGSIGGIAALARILRRGVPVLGLPVRKYGIATAKPGLQLMGVLPTAAALQHPPKSLGHAYQPMTASHSGARSQMEYERQSGKVMILWMDGDVVLDMQRRARLAEASRKAARTRKKMRSARAKARKR